MVNCEFITALVRVDMRRLGLGDGANASLFSDLA